MHTISAYRNESATRSRRCAWAEGFTLLEMLIVVAIIAVLVAIAIPVFSSQLERAREATCQSNRKALEELVKADYMSDGLMSDYQTIFNEDYDTAIYTCPDGGAFSIDGDTGKVSCSVHKDETTGLTLATGGNIPNTALKSTLSTLDIAVDRNQRIDSTSGSDKVKQIENALAASGVSLEDQDIKSWAIINESGTVTYWWTDVDISTCKAGDMVRVIRYNPKKGTYTAAYASVGTSPSGNYIAFSAIVARGNASWSEIPNQTNASKKSYEETLAYFNAANQMKSGS